jgi:hypothetical protein
VGVATQNPKLVRGLVVADKTQRVANFQAGTVHALLELLGAAGLTKPSDLQPWHLQRRVPPTEVKSYAEIYHHLEPGELLGGGVPPEYARWMEMSTPDSFAMLCPAQPRHAAAGAASA